MKSIPTTRASLSRLTVSTCKMRVAPAKLMIRNIGIDALFSIPKQTLKKGFKSLRTAHLFAILQFPLKISYFSEITFDREKGKCDFIKKGFSYRLVIYRVRIYLSMILNSRRRFRHALQVTNSLHDAGSIFDAWCVLSGSAS
jgi:hypothetical protein